MQRNDRRALLVGVAAPLALALGAGPALAHGKGSPAARPIQVQGMVISATNSDLQIETQVGAVHLNLAPSTQVDRRVQGTQDDLRTSQHIQVHLIPGSTIVDAIVIDKPFSPRADVTLGKQRPVRPIGHEHENAPTHPPKPRPWSRLTGQVTALGDSTITLRDPRGSVTYSLASSVSITKIMAGSVRDLAMGEMVRALEGRDDNAILVSILNA